MIVWRSPRCRGHTTRESDVEGARLDQDVVRIPQAGQQTLGPSARGIVQPFALWSRPIREGSGCEAPGSNPYLIVDDRALGPIGWPPRHAGVWQQLSSEPHTHAHAVPRPGREWKGGVGEVLQVRPRHHEEFEAPRSIRKAGKAV
eukprot:601492-Prymnesium_polylepis.1